MKAKTSKVWLMTMNMYLTLIFKAKYEKGHNSYSDLYLDMVYVRKSRTEIGEFVEK